MKRFSSFVICLLMICVLLVGGCTKADSADIKMCQNMYLMAVQKYTTDKKYVFETSTIQSISKQIYRIDLWSQKNYNYFINNEIESDSFEENSQNMNFGLLKNGNEYQILSYAVANYFAKYDNEVTASTIENLRESGISIPQKEFTNLYLSVEGLENVLASVVSKKENLNTSCKNGVRQTNDIVQKTNFEGYLLSYQSLLEKMSKINRAFQNIHFNYFYKFDEESAIIKAGQIQRFVDSAILYCGAFYYIKDMKMSPNVQNAFNHGVDKDTGFSQFASIVTSYGDKTVADDTSDSAPFIYRVSAKKLLGVQNDFENFENACEKINQYLKKNKINSIDETRDDYNQIKPYNDFVKVYNQNILNLQSLILSYIG